MIADLFVGLSLVGACSLIGWWVGKVVLAGACADPEEARTYARFGAWLGAIAGCVAASGVLS